MLHRTHVISLFALALLLLGACKKDDTQPQFQGNVRRGNNGNSLSGVKVNAQTQELGNGVFNSDYTTIGSTTTDGSGAYTIPFELATYSALRLEFTKSQYHRKIVDVSPNYFESSDVYTKNIQLYPQATLSLHVADGLEDYDAFQFRYKDIDFECTCCDDSWKVIDQPNIDTTISCMVYGDQFVYYQYRLIAPGVDTLLQDSIYCPAFTTQQIDLTY